MADVAHSAIEGGLPGSAETAERWAVWKRIGFRFLCSYFFLYCFPTPLVALPGARFLATPFEAVWTRVCPWVATHIFHLSGPRTTYFETGSGDTTLDYIRNLLLVFTAAVAAAVWTALDRKRANYRALNVWLRLLVRYTLAFTLLGYGFDKVFPLQFQPPNFYRLIETYGDFSPMGVLWSFMGASVPYTIFAGAAEVTGGLLLLFRRTATLGALISFGVLANVVALNFCYDVPVKLFSANLLAQAAFLAASDAQRLLSVLVLNRAAGPADLGAPAFGSRWMRVGATAFWAVLVLNQIALINLYPRWNAYKQTYINRPRAALSGIYEVEIIRAGSENGPTVAWAGSQWRRVGFGTGFVSVQTVDGSRGSLRVQYAAGANAITLDGISTLRWRRVDETHVAMEGTLEGAAVYMRLRRMELTEFALMGRGFHWINEYPFNR